MKTASWRRGAVGGFVLGKNGDIGWGVASRFGIVDETVDQVTLVVLKRNEASGKRQSRETCLEGAARFCAANHAAVNGDGATGKGRTALLKGFAKRSEGAAESRAENGKVAIPGRITGTLDRVDNVQSADELVLADTAGR